MLRLASLGRGAAIAAKRASWVKKNWQPSGLVSLRNIWGFSKQEEEPKEATEEADQSQDNQSRGIVSPSGDNAPNISPLLILPNKRVLFPGHITGLMLKDEVTIDALTNNKSPSGNYVGLFYRKSEDVTDVIRSMDDVHHVGTFAQIQNAVRTDMGLQLVLLTHRRLTLTSITSPGPPTLAHVQHWKKLPPQANNATTKAYVNEILAVARELIKQNPLLREQMQLQSWVMSHDMTDPRILTDLVISLTTAENSELQRILELTGIEERLAAVLELMGREKEMMRIQKDIQKQVEEKVNKQQREYFLREQLKTIKKELGMEKDDKEDLLNKYKTKLQTLKDTHAKLKDTHSHVYASLEPVIKVINDEVNKLEGLDKSSPEYNITRTYLDWLHSLPWGVYTSTHIDLQRARSILDEDHYGLEDVKQSILEFIAVAKLTNKLSGKILCLVGPPGVGKTSVAKSVARALNKPFYRFSVGGLGEGGEVRGHRRTYIGSMPGKPVYALKYTQCMNPVILVDEIDKVVGRGGGGSSGGDPASALLELLDPNQNASFTDHYMDVPIDFSEVVFVCTANDESLIPGPLRDRMEMIRIGGYDMTEKVAIAERYLVPKALRENGLWNGGNQEKSEEADKQGEVPHEHMHVTPQSTATAAASAEMPYSIPPATLSHLIKGWCRESGVRQLEKTIDKLTRKLAYEQVTQEAHSTQSSSQVPQVIHPEDLQKYIGKPKFMDDNMFNTTNAPTSPLPAGVVMGLAWNPLGGSPIFIETVALPIAAKGESEGEGKSIGTGGAGGIRIVTGQLGDVMKESVSIAYTYITTFLHSLPAQRQHHGFFNTHSVHIHVPEGAVSKDGPSAGIAMACALISLATNTPLKAGVAMTGELSLTGKVLPIGGVKEKVLAAKRAQASIVILPRGNQKDFEELPDYVKQDVQVHFVQDYSEVYKLVF